MHSSIKADVNLQNVVLIFIIIVSINNYNLLNAYYTLMFYSYMH